MGYRALHGLLQSIFYDLNVANDVPSLDHAWRDHAPEITGLLTSPEAGDEFVPFDDTISVPKAMEAARMLRSLRRRYSSQEDGRPLVGRIRADVVMRRRPRRDRPRSALTGEARSIAELAPAGFSAFSAFQVEGWSKVCRAVESQRGMVVVAPTGAGKTEVFLMPLIHKVAQGVDAEGNNGPRFVLLYPRVTLLKDQLSRVFRYVNSAEQRLRAERARRFGSGGGGGSGIVIGFQFGGIRSTYQATLNNPEIFGSDGTFRVVEECPVCGAGTLKVHSAERRGSIMTIRCDHDACRASFKASISKSDHARAKPHLLITTVESLDQLYLKAEAGLENYLRSFTGVVFDEAHLYQSTYGAHVYNIVRRFEELRGGAPLTKIAASATISNPERFSAKLFYGNENRTVDVHSADDYEQVPAGLEIILFLQSPQESNFPGASPTLIQTVMAMGHGVLSGEDRALVFTDSLDMVNRLNAQINDAEQNKRLWDFRLSVPDILFDDHTCPRTNPADCTAIYQRGECWRGMLGGRTCYQPTTGLRDDRALAVHPVSSRQRTGYEEGDVVVATSALEVGVDDERIKATIHYLPPRTVFSFIQRRGRAGRSMGESAYTLMVLGNTPSDHFYLFRRNRLVHGTYDLPLNPENPIIRAMHDRLQTERERMGQLIDQYRPQLGVWRWVWEKLYGCPLLRDRYGPQLAQFDIYNVREHDPARQELRGWIAREKEIYGNYLSLRWLLHEIATESPDELREAASEVLAAAEDYLTGQTANDTNVRQRLLDLNRGLSDLILLEDDDEAGSHLERVRDKLQQVWQTLRRNRGSVDLEAAERLYDFFRVLERLVSREHVLNHAPEALKVVLQAMFYLHLGLREDQESGACRSRIDYYVPDSYFQDVTPVVVEAHNSASPERADSSQLHAERMTDLATTLIPYKPVYRYYGHRFLSALDLDYVERNGNIVTVHLRAEGVRRGGTLSPQKVSVRPLRTDDGGQQLTKMCPECFRIYSIGRTRPCHGRQLETVKLHTEPVVQRHYETRESRPLTRTLSFLESVEGNTTVLGSSVEGKRYYYDRQAGEYRSRGEAGRFDFEARYDAPLLYRLSTKGLAWDLSRTVDGVLADDELRAQVEQAMASSVRKSLDEELVLHTAAHMLHKAVAAISGVNEQVLEYSYNLPRREVVVWERYEGGSGVSETFADVLRANPTDVYEELLASVLCPVNLAESEDWGTAEELSARLAARWSLPRQNGFVGRVCEEAESERSVQASQPDEETRLVCRPPQGYDGCPACMHTTNCTDRHEQVTAVSRMVGERLLSAFVGHLSRQEAEQEVGDSIAREEDTPTVLDADQERGTYGVLLL